MNRAVSPSSTRWPLERVLFAMAGSVTVISAVLAAVVSPWFLLLTGFVGVNQWMYVALGACPASLVLKRTCGLRSSLYPVPAYPAAASTAGGTPTRRQAATRR